MTPIFYYRIVISMIRCNFLQSLKKILLRRFRATLNFRKFKVALKSLRRNFLNFAKSSDSSVVSLESSPWPKYTQLEIIFQKKSCSTIKLFFFFKYVIYYTVLSKWLTKNRGHRARLREKENLFRYPTIA